MLNYQVKVGLAPMRRDVTPRPGIFNWEKAEERGRAAREIATMIAQNPSAVQREIFAGKAADALGVSKSALLDDIRHERSKQAKQTHKQLVQTQVRQMQGISDRINPDAAKNRRSARAEEQILGILLAAPELCAKVFSPCNDELALTSDDFFTEFHKKLFVLIKDQFEKDGETETRSPSFAFLFADACKTTRPLV